ncbi:hypothetical protein J4441_02800 [Candidatus Micrarchaeota archaeon]|nr:hypothetical protein [Candidatus Micrarchaeota archaeon]
MSEITSPEAGVLFKALEKSFSSVSLAIFKKGIGHLQTHSDFLSAYISPQKKSKSCFSGSEVFFSAPYSPKAKFMALEEKNKARSKFSINDIKDIDSLARALAENAVYCGSKIIGNCGHVHSSDNVSDSFYVYLSHDILKSEYIAFCELTINSKHLFGCSSTGETEFCINATETYRATRVFESAIAVNSTDLYYCYYCIGCCDCFFSFNQHSKSNMIGNNQLGREEYASLKKELLSQLASDLESGKRVPNLKGMVGNQ